LCYKTDLDYLLQLILNKTRKKKLNKKSPKANLQLLSFTNLRFSIVTALQIFDCILFVSIVLILNHTQWILYHTLIQYERVLQIFLLNEILYRSTHRVVEK